MVLHLKEELHHHQSKSQVKDHPLLQVLPSKVVDGDLDVAPLHPVVPVEVLLALQVEVENNLHLQSRSQALHLAVALHHRVPAVVLHRRLVLAAGLPLLVLIEVLQVLREAERNELVHRLSVLRTIVNNPQSHQSLPNVTVLPQRWPLNHQSLPNVTVLPRRRLPVVVVIVHHQ